MLRLPAERLAFAAAIILTVALGIGMSTSMFSMVDVARKRPLHYPEEGRLVRLGQRIPGIGYSQYWLSECEYLDYRERQNSFESFAVYRTTPGNLARGEKSVQINVASVSDGFFEIRMAGAFLGRTFRPDDHTGCGAVVILAYDTWRDHFDGDREVVGRTAELDGRNVSIVGVMPPGFGLPYHWVDAWIPLAVDREDSGAGQAPNLLAIARLKPDVTIAAASSDVNNIALHLHQVHPNADYIPSFAACAVPLEVGVAE